MDIEGSAFHLPHLEGSHDECTEVLIEFLCSVFGNVDTVTIEKDRNVRGTVDCITLRDIYVERDLLEPIEQALETVFGAPFFIFTSGDERLIVNDDHQTTLAAALEKKVAARAVKAKQSTEQGIK